MNYRLVGLLVLFSIILISPVSGQLTWQNVDSLFSPLPPSVHVYKSTDSIGGKPNICYYVSAELADRSIDFTTQVGRSERLTPQQFYTKENKPIVVVNGTFFSFADNRNLNVVIRNGQMQAYNVPVVKGKNDSLYSYITRSAIGINHRRKADVAWLFTDTALRYPYALLNGPSTATGPNPDPEWPDLKKQIKGGGRKKMPWKMQTAIGGGPVLLQMGRIAITNKEEHMFANGEHDLHPRTAMGYTRDGKLIILAVEGRNPGIAAGMSLRQMAEVMQQIGCHEALNLDGGGSSCLLVNGKETIKPSDKEGQRPVSAVFIIQALR